MFEEIAKYWGFYAAFLAAYGAIAVLFYRVSRVEKDQVDHENKMVIAINSLKKESSDQISLLKKETKDETDKLAESIKELRNSTHTDIKDLHVKVDTVKDIAHNIEKSLARLEGPTYPRGAGVP